MHRDSVPAAAPPAVAKTALKVRDMGRCSIRRRRDVRGLNGTARRSATRRRSLPRRPAGSAYSVAMGTGPTARRPKVGRHVAESVFVAVASGCWTAVSGRSVKQRRLLRVGLVALAITLPAAAASTRPRAPGPPADNLPPTTTRPLTSASGVPDLSDAPAAEDQPVDQSGTPAHAPVGFAWQRLVVSVGAGVALTVAGRSARLALEKRWLRALARHHRNPHLALGIRVSLVVLAGTLPARLISAAGRAR